MPSRSSIMPLRDLCYNIYIVIVQQKQGRNTNSCKHRWFHPRILLLSLLYKSCFGCKTAAVQLSVLYSLCGEKINERRNEIFPTLTSLLIKLYFNISKKI